MTLVFPEMLHDLFRDDHYKQPLNMVLDHVMAVNLAVCSEQIEAVEKATRLSQNCGCGHCSEQAERLPPHSAQFARETHHNRLQAVSRASVYPDSHIMTPTTRWSIKHEKCAKAAYVTRMMAEHVHFSVRDSGFVIHREYLPYCFPDGVTWCDCHGEVKFPYILREEDITTASERATCLSKDTGGN